MNSSACTEWMFTEHEDYGSHIRAAQAAGLQEFEVHSCRSDKSLALIKTALDETGVRLLSFCVEATLRDKGYSGTTGLEYLPSLPSLESLALSRRTLELDSIQNQ